MKFLRFNVKTKFFEFIFAILKQEKVIYGIGTDIVEVARIDRQLDSPAFMEKIFTANEMQYCQPKKSKAQNFAARFAAKEAFFKAIGTGMRDGMSFNEIEVLNDELGKPSLKIHGLTKKYMDKCNVTDIHVSLTHIKEYACAYVIVETN